MNGKRAKRLRKAAEAMCLSFKDEDGESISLGLGYNRYNQARNMVGPEAVYDDDGFPVMDPQGYPMVSIVNTLPGTITCAWKLRVMYQGLKREYKYAFRGYNRTRVLPRPGAAAGGDLGGNGIGNDEGSSPGA